MFKRIIANAGWLSLVQLLNYLIPVVTLPVIAHSFGSSTFGIFATISAYAGYVGILVSYSFGWTGPRRIANLKTIETISEFVSATIGAQLLLALAGSGVYLVVLILLPGELPYKTVAALVLAQTIANSISPQWVFLGLEQLRSYALVQLVTRLSAAGAIAYWIKSPADLTLLSLINASSASLAATISFILLRTFGFRWRTPTIKYVATILRDAFGLFISSMSISFYTTSNVIIVTHVLGPSSGGAFAVADRLRQATSGVLAPITSAIYPLVCRVADRRETSSETRAKQFFFRIIVLAAASLSIFLFVFAGTIIHIVAGSDFQDATALLRWLAFLPLVIALSNILGVQTMLPMQMDREVTFVVSGAGLASVAAVYVFTSLAGLSGAGAAILAVECSVTIAFAWIISRRLDLMSLFRTSKSA